MKPRWIIDDTSEPGRVFCEHTEDPPFVGELLPDDKAPLIGLAIPAPGGQWVCNIRWLEESESYFYEEQDMYDSLEEALAAHEAAKASNGPLGLTAAAARLPRR